MNLRKYAKGKPCQIRLPGCRPGNETVVLCHIRTPTTGVARKEPDLLGIWGCEWCHSVLDGRRRLPGWTEEEIKIAGYDGLIRTQQELIKQGVVKW